MTEGIYPNYLKEAQIVPLRKSGDSTICSNYRLISLLSQFNEIFEKLLHARLYGYLKDFGLLSEHQCGFQPNSSKAFAVEDIYFNLLANHDEGLHTCSLFINCSKAFDNVNHEIIFKKMEMNFGIRGIPLMLMKSYLTNRGQFTLVQNMASKINKITCGVPQGSTLGPLFFIMYVNDLPKCSSFSIKLYADDTYLCLAHGDLKQFKLMVNNELIKVDEWMRLNKLSINYAKSMYFLTGKSFNKAEEEKKNFKINIKNVVLHRKTSVQYLGVLLDESLNWTSHVKYLKSKLSFASSMIYKI